KNNKDVTTKTLNDLCRILHCDICDLVRYIPSEDDQPL
ncbi:MAG: helix-turn-helix domain-containing protein, partial [Eubacterium sp.]|nr:helix-turn-helix domain-containing protein [Eubacterium sp.]